LVPNPDEEETTEEINDDYDYDVASTDEVDTLGLNINDEPTRGGAHQHYSTNDTVVSEITTPAAIAPPLETLELRNNSTPSTSVTTANCELVQQVNTHSCNGGESGGGGTGRTAVDSSVNPSSSINTTTPPSDDQQLPMATAEPMGQMSALICNDKFIQIKWWHFVIVMMIILVIVLPSTLIPQQQRKRRQEQQQQQEQEQEEEKDWIEEETNWK